MKVVKNDFKKHSNIINSKVVYAKDNQVFLKNSTHLSVVSKKEEEWSAINFQWIPVMNLNKELKNN